MNKLLIIIPCLNEELYLDNLVNKLVADTTNLDSRIIIADGGSTDKTIDIAKGLEDKFPNVFYLNNPKKLQSAAVNLAVEIFGTNYEYFIRIDAHSDYPSDFCKKLLGEATKTGADSVVVAMDTVGKSGFQKAVAAAQNSKLGNGGSAHRNNTDGAWVDHGHHALMRVSAFRAVGGYDETFSHNEDAELDFRLTQAGYKIWLTAQTTITYYPRTTINALFKQYFKFGEGRARTIFKHKIKPRVRQMIPLVVAPAAFIFPLIQFPILVWAGICLAYGVRLAQDKNDNEIYLSGVAIMTMHLAWSMGFWWFALRNIKQWTK